MSLLASKLVDLAVLISQFLNCVRASKWQLQQLAGKLNWTWQAVYGGRTFFWNILITMNRLVCLLPSANSLQISMQTFSGGMTFMTFN